MAKNKMYRYYCLFRPPVPGAIPRGVSRIVAFDDIKPVEEIGRVAWGYVEYHKPLTAQEVVQYELAASPENGQCGPDRCEV